MTAPRLEGSATVPRSGSAPLNPDPARRETEPAALFEGLRQQIAAARRARDASTQVLSAPGAEGLAASLAQAGALAEIGTTLPPFTHLSWPRRLFARASGRVLIYLLRVITIDQQHFNRLVLAAVRGLTADTGALRARIEALDSAVEDQRRAMLDAVASERELLRGQSAAIAELRDTSGLLLMQTDAVKRLLASGGGPAIGADPPDHRLESGPLGCTGVDESVRGSLEKLKDQQRRYLRHFAEADNVLDVGCGAGPFLELLRDAGVRAQGVDIDDQAALWCQERGLTVRCMDALEYLDQLEDGALGGLFCAQVVEHFRPPQLLRFMQLVARKLRPGAPIVIETLNPESLLVHYRWFWMNLTHERLIHPETLSFLLRSYGFHDVTCDFVPPPPGPLHIPPLAVPGEAPERLDEFNRATQYLNQLLYGSFDYAAVAVR